ncbi:hypothetical protein ACFYUV_03860 [Nonomuraea sp. NPDC003560]|uniref:hypothetical protein n=1 Tax=Nonomuraea sp. NPDC003560 TaxID=3364341 RepID=UPI0036C64C19
MNNPMRLNEEATSTQGCADAETAQPNPHDELTADQLAGRACVECGATGKPMRVVGEVPGHGDVYECDAHTARRGCKPWCIGHRGDVCHAESIYASRGGSVGLTYSLAEGVRVHIGSASALTLDEALDYNQAIIGQVSKGVRGEEAETVEPKPDPLQEMRAVLGVDAVTGLDLADAVKAGMVLGQMLASDADTRLTARDLTGDEHDDLRQAVQDLLDRRRGVNPDRERMLLAFGWGNLAAWQIASELDMDGVEIARATTREADGAPFSDSEKRRLLSTLFDILDEREGIAGTGANA